MNAKIFFLYEANVQEGLAFTLHQYLSIPVAATQHFGKIEAAKGGMLEETWEELSANPGELVVEKYGTMVTTFRGHDRRLMGGTARKFAKKGVFPEQDWSLNRCCMPSKTADDFFAWWYGKFDYVMSNETFQWLHNTLGMLAEAFKVRERGV